MGGHGEIGLQEAIIVSSNTFFFSLAYNQILKTIDHLSFLVLVEIYVSIVFCQIMDYSISLKMNTHNFGWFKGDTVNLGVGQGYMNATPIQLAITLHF